MTHWVYILYSERLNRFYTGETANLSNRMKFHEIAKSYKFTSNAKDWTLFLKIACQTKEQALKIEAHIKKMKSSTYIKNLKKYPEMRIKILKKYSC